MSRSTVTDMEKIYQRISELSGLPNAEILTFALRLRSLSADPETVRDSINDHKTVRDHRLAAWDIVRGAALLVATGALVVLSPTLTSAGWAVGVIAAFGGAAFIASGLSVRRVLAAKLRVARILRRELEAEDGFLWKFQRLLEHLGADGPHRIHDSLARCCQSSRRREDVGKRDDLVQYFYWIGLIEMHLVVAEKGLHDKRLEPYETNHHG